MKTRSIVLSFVFLALIGCVWAQTVGRLGTTVPAVPLVPPSPPATPSLSCPAATGVQGVPYNSTFTASGGTAPYVSYVIVVGPLPPGLSLTASTGAITGTSSTPGTYGFTGRVTDTAAQTGTQSCSIVISPPASFTSHPRTLTSTKLSELAAKKKINHADYVALKAFADDVLYNAPWLTDVTSLTASLNSSATSFSVTDGSIFPSSNLYVRIDKELIFCTTRTTNTLSGCTRHAGWPGLWDTVTESHASGVAVWDHQTPGGTFLYAADAFAMLTILGDTSYATAARAALNLNVVYAAQIFPGAPPVPIYCHQDYFRWYVPLVAWGYDWLYNSYLTANEKAVYATWLGEAVHYQQIDDDPVAGGLLCQQAPKEWYAVQVVGTPSIIQSVLVSNAAAGQVYTTALAAAVSYGDNVDALAQWNEAMRKIDTYVMPAITTGAASGGLVPEGTQYQGETFAFISGVLNLIETATGDTSRSSTANTWIATMLKAIFYQTLPGGTNSTVATTGSMASGSQHLIVADGTGFEVGQLLRFATGTTGPDVIESRILAKSGTDLTLVATSPVTVTAQTILHAHSTVYTRGDASEGSDGFNEGWIGDEFFEGAFIGVERLRTANPTIASYTRWWYDHEEAWHLAKALLAKFIWDDTTVSAVDYHGALPTLWANTTNEAGNGILIGRSDWTTQATAVMFQVGGEVVDHQHADWGAYQIRRKGVPLSVEIYGYGVVPYPGIWADGAGFKVGEGKYTGGRYHNSVLMNGHSGNNTHGIEKSPTETRPALMKRSYADDTAGYMYMRGDESYQFVSTGSAGWSQWGYANDYAQSFNRDFLYVKAADLIVFADRLTYSTPTTSATTWMARFSGDPTVVGQRITATYAGQSIVQDVVVPSGATLTEINENTELSDLNTYVVRPSWRIETTSGVSATPEWSLQVIQLGDSGFTPATVTSLTTTNANVAQFGTTYVVGAMKDLTPTLNVSYVVSGTPRNLIMGLMPSTAYHVTRSTNTITIAAATGSGDTTASSAGVLDFTL